MSTRSTIILRLAAVCTPLVIFLILATPRLDLPGLHYDEALEGGLPAIQLLNGQPMTALNDAALHLGGRTIPLMVQNHIGAMQVYAALPFAALGGPTASALRAMTVVGGLLTIVATYLFVAQLYGRFAAFWSSLWLAGFASFVFWSRQGTFVTSLALCFAMWALATGVYWWRTRHLWALGLASLCTGLAVYSKLNALWLVLGVGSWIMLTQSQVLVRHRAPRPTWRTLFVAGLGLLLGLGPLILYNVLSHGATYKTIRASATQTYLGQNNTEVLHNLQVRLAQAADVLRSGDHLWYLGGSYRNPVAFWSVLGGFLILLGSCVWGSGRAQWRSTLLVPWIAVLVIAQSCFTISALWPTHFAIATPLPAMIFGLGTAKAYHWLTTHRLAGRIGRLSVVAVAIMVVGFQVGTSWRYLEAVKSTGGLSFHSASIYELSRFLGSQAEPAVALDWGIATQVRYLNGGRTVVDELYSFQPDPTQFGSALRERVNRDELYITHASNQEAFPHRSLFLETVAQNGWWAERVHTIMGASGWAELEVWRVHRQ